MRTSTAPSFRTAISVCKEISAASAGRDRVIPVAMEDVLALANRGKLRFAHLDSFVGIGPCPDGFLHEARFGGGGSDHGARSCSIGWSRAESGKPGSPVPFRLPVSVIPASTAVHAPRCCRHCQP